MGVPTFPTSDWLGLIMDWELADSSTNLEASSTISNEGAISDDSNTALVSSTCTNPPLGGFFKQQKPLMDQGLVSSLDTASGSSVNQHGVAGECSQGSSTLGLIYSSMSNSYTSLLRESHHTSRLMLEDINGHEMAPLNGDVNLHVAAAAAPPTNIADHDGGGLKLSGITPRMAHHVRLSELAAEGNNTIIDARSIAASGQFNAAASSWPPPTALESAYGVTSRRRNKTSRPGDHNQKSLTISFSIDDDNHCKLDYDTAPADDIETLTLITGPNCRPIKKAKHDDSSARHCLAERKRREKLNKNFENLRALVSPSLSVKTDKASIIEAAVKLLIDKKGQPTALASTSEKEVDRKGMPVAQGKVEAAKAHDKAIHCPSSLIDAQKSTERYSFSEVFCDLQDEFMAGSNYDHTPTIQVNRAAATAQRSHYIVSVRARDRPGVFSDIIIALTKLNLRILFSNSCSCNNSSKTSSPITWFLSKIEAVDESSKTRVDLQESIHDAIQKCVA